MTTNIWSDSAISELSESDISDFEEIVLRDLKNRNNSDDKSILQNNLDLWLFSLRSLRRSVEYQLTSNKIKVRSTVQDMRNDSSYTEDDISSFIIDEEKWRANATKFLVAIERKTLYVKLLIQEED